MAAVSVTIKFTKNDASRDFYSNSDIKNLVSSYISSGKILKQDTERSSDNLVETTTTVFENQGTFQEFRSEEINKNNTRLRDSWCYENSISYEITVDGVKVPNLQQNY